MVKKKTKSIFNSIHIFSNSRYKKISFLDSCKNLYYLSWSIAGDCLDTAPSSVKYILVHLYFISIYIFLFNGTV